MGQKVPISRVSISAEVRKISLDKAIEHGKERRNPVISPDSWCRNNGGCHYCESDRLHKYRKREITADEKMKEAETEMHSKAKSAQAKMKNIYTERLVLREMTEDDFRVYLNHLTEADEVFVQYGIEPTEELLNEISMFPDMLYYSIIEKRAATLSVILKYMKKVTISHFTFSKSTGAEVTAAKPLPCLRRLTFPAK